MKCKLELVLFGDDLGQRPIGRVLAWDRAGPDALEGAIEPDGAGGGARRNQLVEAGEQVAVGQRPVDLPLDRRLEAGDDRERGPLRGRHRVDPALDVGPVEIAVEGDHLAVQPVQRAEAEVALLSQLGEAEVAVVGAVEQRPDRRRLEEDVRLVSGVQIPPAHRLHVHGPDPALVEHRGSLPRPTAADGGDS
jgi:hypothetical protein